MKENKFKIIKNINEILYTMIILFICESTISIMAYFVYFNNPNSMDLGDFFKGINIFSFLVLLISIIRIILLLYESINFCKGEKYGK